MHGPLTGEMVPVYNGERCLGSAPHTMQSYHVVQVIDIDDGSTDKSITIPQSLAQVKLRSAGHVQL